MKNKMNKLIFCALFAGLLAFSCEDDSSDTGGPIEPTPDGRFFTIAQALSDGETAGNGNGGTKIYAVTQENIQNPDFEINVDENGFLVPSQRTARLQSSVDGSQIFNIVYGGDNGGQFNKYNVNGQSNFEETGGTVSIAQYAGSAPRWVKLQDGDKTGVAVSMTRTDNAEVDDNGTPENVEDDEFLYKRELGTVVSVDMQEVVISEVNSGFEIPLSEEEEAMGYYIFRLDAPCLNAAGDKLIIGTWMGKLDPETGGRDGSEYERLGTKSVVVDYPSLQNPQLISSTVGNGDTSGYRSGNAELAADGNIYQYTHRDTNGSHILKINAENEYENSYGFSLDEALGVTNSYIESWRLVGDNIAYAMYTHDGSAPSDFNDGGSSQSFLARIDLTAQTAEQVDLPYAPDMYFFQYQGYAVDNDDLYIAVSEVGKNGNVYIIDSATGEVTKGAQLINQPGNHFIGVF